MRLQDSVDCGSGELHGATGFHGSDAQNVAVGNQFTYFEDPKSAITMKKIQTHEPPEKFCTNCELDRVPAQVSIVYVYRCKGHWIPDDGNGESILLY